MPRSCRQGSVHTRLTCRFEGSVVVRGWQIAALVVLLVVLPIEGVSAQLAYPQVIRMKYEAAEAAGGSFVIWLDRERIHHGLDSKLYPRVRYVEITHLTPSPGSPIITMIEVMNVNSSVPDFYHVAGIVRFKMTGMTLKWSNAGR